MADDGIEGDGGLSRGAVADDQLSLPPADGDHTVDRLYPGMHRGIHRLAQHYIGSHPLYRVGLFILYRPLAIQRLPQRVYHPPDETITHRHLGDPPGAAHLIPLLDLRVVSEDNHANTVLFKIECKPNNPIGELDQFVIPGPIKTMNASDAIADLNHSAHIHHCHHGAELLDLLSDDRGNILGSSHLLYLQFIYQPGFA